MIDTENKKTGALESLGWYLNRLKCMSAGEILYRVRNRVLSDLQSRGMFTAHKVPKITPPGKEQFWFKGTREVDLQEYIDSADKIIAGRLTIFVLKNADLGQIPDWNRDPRTGTIAEKTFGKKLNYRESALVGDIKYLWEPNRHLQLVRVAQAYYLSEDDKYLEALSRLLESWFDQCDYLKGPNWTSSLELGIRLINWSIVWQLVGGYKSSLFKGDNGKRLRVRWCNSIYQHCHFINGYWSRFSSANNHLIGEAAGLYVASVTWPFWRSSAHWAAKSKKILLKEAQKQNYEDGVNKEQATSYQQFVLDFLLFAGLAAKTAGDVFPREYWDRIKSMMVFLQSIMDREGNVPMIGDADDGYVVSLVPDETFNPYQSLLDTGAMLFDRSELTVKIGSADAKTRWLLGDGATFAAGTRQTLSSPRKTCFDQGGYYILGCDYGSDREIHCVADAGPLGYLSIAAHGHADALSFVLSVGGHEILVDPGTYAYHTKKKWRDYFRGTGAHNTVRVDGVDQSEPGGNFMWLRKAQAQCESWQNDDTIAVFIANHDGYTRLKDPLIHQRSITMDKKNRRLQVVDNIKCSGDHLVERFWHFSENCSFSGEGADFLVENKGQLLKIRLSSGSGATVSRYRGSEAPVFGWISRGFDKKEPITTVVEKIRISGNAQLIADIDIQ